MKRKGMFAACVALALAGCQVDPQAAADRRASLMQSIFPSAADRQGLHLVFPIESGGLLSYLEIVYFPDEVAQSSIADRANRYCQRFANNNVTGNAFLRQGPIEGTVTLDDGTVRNIRRVDYSCFPPR